MCIMLQLSKLKLSTVSSELKADGTGTWRMIENEIQSHRSDKNHRKEDL